MGEPVLEDKTTVILEIFSNLMKFHFGLLVNAWILYFGKPLINFRNFFASEVFWNYGSYEQRNLEL